MRTATRLTSRLLAIVFFLLALGAVLVALFAPTGQGRSPGLFLAIVLAGIGKWLFGVSRGHTASQTFGKAIDVVDAHDPNERSIK